MKKLLFVTLATCFSFCVSAQTKSAYDTTQKVKDTAAAKSLVQTVQTQEEYAQMRQIIAAYFAMQQQMYLDNLDKRSQLVLPPKKEEPKK